MSYQQRLQLNKISNGNMILINIFFLSLSLALSAIFSR